MAGVFERKTTGASGQGAAAESGGGVYARLTHSEKQENGVFARLREKEANLQMIAQAQAERAAAEVAQPKMTVEMQKELKDTAAAMANPANVYGVAGNQMTPQQRADQFARALTMQQEQAESAYDSQTVAKGKESKENPLNQDPKEWLAGGGMGQVGDAIEKKQLIDGLTEEQKTYINYLYGAYDSKTAEKLTDTLLQNIRNQQILTSDVPGEKQQNAISAVAGSINYLPYAARLVAQAVQNKITGTDRTVPEYSAAARAMSEQMARTGAFINEAETPLGQFARQTGASIGNNLVNMLLFGEFAPVVMAVQAAAGEGYEAAQNGATGSQQIGKAVQAGVTEYLTEKISWGKLEDILKSTGSKSAKALLAQVGAQMLTEAGEETVNEALGMLYDWIAMGEAGDLKQVFRKYQSENGNSEAAIQVALEILKRLGGAAAGGAISGGILGGGATMINQIMERTRNEPVTAPTESTAPQTKPAEIAGEAADLPKTAAAEPMGEEMQVQPEGVQGQYDVDRTAVNDNADEHTLEQQLRIEEYKKSADWNLAAFFDRAKERYLRSKKGQTESKKEPPYYIGKVSEKAVEDIRQLTGIDTAENGVYLSDAGVGHILRRHGENGNADHSMRYTEDVARIPWVLKNYDGAFLSKNKTEGYVLKNGKKAPGVYFWKKINGNYIVLEAVTDTNSHRNFIVSAQFTKNIEEFKRKTEAAQSLINAQSPQATSETIAATNTSVTENITQETQEVKPEALADETPNSVTETPVLQSNAKNTAPATVPDTARKSTGWNNLKGNRIVEAMLHKPEEAVASIGDAANIRAVEKEIAKAEKLARGLEETAQAAEIDMAKSVAAGRMKLDAVNPQSVNIEMVERLADEYRLINRLQESGLQGQKRALHMQEFARAERLLNEADAELFEKGNEKLRERRQTEAGKLRASTSERVMRRVFGDTKAAQQAIDEYITPTERNEAAKVGAIGRLFEDARKLDLNSYESTMVQLVGEHLAPEWSEAGGNPMWKNGQQLLESLPEYARQNKEIRKLVSHMGEIDHKKVMDAVQWYRKTYDDFFTLVNDFRLAHGMREIGRQEDYFPHFSNEMDGDMLNKTLKAFGIEQMSDLPASVAGMTVGFRPNTRWVGNFQKRTGPQTVFDANMGFQMYANAVMDMLYHTDDIMRIRHLEQAIREQSQTIQKQGKKMTLEERAEARKKRIEDPEELQKLEEEMENVSASAKDLAAEYGGFVIWLREYGNRLANKGSMNRWIETHIGRSKSNKLNKLLGNYATAQIVGNIRSALANTAIIPKMIAMLGTQDENAAGKANIYIGQALVKMARGEMRDIYAKSEFLTGKKGVKPLSQTPKERAADWLMSFFNVVEEAMSNLTFTAKYVQVQDQMRGSGKTAAEVEKEAIKQANAFAAQIMARRDKAGGTLLSGERDPLVRLLNMFQTEIANEWQMYTQDIPTEIKRMTEKIGKKKTAKVYGIALARMLVYSHILAVVAESVFGINPYNDPLGWLWDLITGIWEEPEEEGEEGRVNWQAAKDFLGDVAGLVPYASGVAALLGYSNDRLPVVDVPELLDNAGSIFTAEKKSGKIEGAIKTASGVAQIVGLPGAGQGEKTAKGILAAATGGKRTQKTGQLQDVLIGEENWADIVRAIVFGPSAMKGMREYYDSGKAELTLTQTNAYDAAVGAGVDKRTALDYVEWAKTVQSEKTEGGTTILNSKKRKLVQKANSLQGLTDEQRMILFLGALDKDDREKLQASIKELQVWNVGTDVILSFMEDYYSITGKGKKERVERALKGYGLTERQKNKLAKAVGWER